LDFLLTEYAAISDDISGLEFVAAAPNANLDQTICDDSTSLNANMLRDIGILKTPYGLNGLFWARKGLFISQG